MDAETQEEFDKLLSIDENNKCIDCDTAHPKWASVNNGCFICINCAGNHRSMGVHISFVRSITMDGWSKIQLSRIQNGGNEKLKQFWEEQKFFENNQQLSFKERLDNEAMDKYRENLLLIAKNENENEISNIPFIGYKKREIIIKKQNNNAIKGMGNTGYNPNKSPKQKHIGKKTAKMLRYGVKAKLALTRTSVTDESIEITQYKQYLKEHKHWLSEVEEIANNLHKAQTELIAGFGSGEALTTIEPYKNDKFGAFLNNLGRIMTTFEESYQIYLMNMEDELIKPLHEFNTREINKVQKVKIKLKTVKGNYDIAKRYENKLLNKNNNNKGINDKLIAAQMESTQREAELTMTANEFVLSIKKMEEFQEKELLTSVKKYFDSFVKFSQIQEESLRENKTTMMIEPFNPGASDEKEMHMIVKEGWMAKRGGGHMSKSFKKRYFKLFTNKKLGYYANDKHNCKPKGHADLEFLQLKKIDEKCFSIQTQSRLWVFQCDSNKERDDWCKVIDLTCVQDKMSNDNIMEQGNNDVYSDTDDDSK